MIGVADNRFTIGKEVYYPFSVELHYFRVDKKYWSICFERIKKAGFRIISTSVPWNLHQDANKNIDFGGFSDPRKDLVVFLELAREFGFKIILRPGPRISAQWPNGGLPQFLFSDLKVFARDSKGQELKLNDDMGVPGGYLPSYLHPHFQHSLRNYFKTLIETTRNYVHPRGPIFMVEIDYEPSFGRYLDPGSADYNPDVLAQYYPEFLASRYEDIKKLNQLYRDKAESFAVVEPPRNFSNLEMKDLPRVFDWFHFREYILKTYLTTLEDIFKSYTVEPLFFRSLYFRPGDQLPAFDPSSREKETMVGANVFPEGGYFDLIQKGRYLRGEYQFAWASAYVSGSPASEKELQSGAKLYADGLRRFYLVAALAGGFKGFNHYMFVDRDHWYGAPLAKDGTISSGYEIVKSFNAAILSSKLNELTPERKICILGSRQYQWMRLLDKPQQFEYIEKLITDSAAGIGRDLLRLKLDYDIRETFDVEALSKYSLVFLFSAEFMPAAVQEGIIELLKRGVIVVACGLMPKYDENFRECLTLSRYLKLKTTLGEGIDTIKLKNTQFTSYVYGHILTTDPKVKRLATAAKKNVGVSFSKDKGVFYLYSFNIGSGCDHNKMSFVESLLNDNDLTSHLYCSDPSIDMAIHKGEKRAVLFIVAPPPGELCSLADTSSREVIIRLDLRKVGIASAKVKVTDLLAGETAQPIKMSSDTFRKGYQIKVDFPDGKIFLIEPK